MIPAYDLPNALRFSKALKQGYSQPYHRPDVTGDDLAFLQYTGGTTGLSKEAMLTHRKIVVDLEQTSTILESVVEKGKELVVTALPLYHIFDLQGNCLTFVKFGCPNLLITNPRDMLGFVAELAKYPFTVITGVNTLFNGLLNTPGFADLDFSRLKFALGGGAAVQRPVAERWQKTTRLVLLEGYLNRPEATDEMIVDGWLATGDMARCDADGYFYC